MSLYPELVWYHTSTVTCTIITRTNWTNTHTHTKKRLHCLKPPLLPQFIYLLLYIYVYKKTRKETLNIQNRSIGWSKLQCTFSKQQWRSLGRRLELIVHTQRSLQGWINQRYLSASPLALTACDERMTEPCSLYRHTHTHIYIFTCMHWEWKTDKGQSHSSVV